MKSDPSNDPGGSHLLSDIVIDLKPGASPPMERIRQAMASVDPNMPILAIRTMKEQVGAQFIQQRLIAQLTSLSEFSRWCWHRSASIA